MPFERILPAFRQVMDREHRRTSTNLKVCDQIHPAAADALSTWSFTHSPSCSVTTLPQISPLHFHHHISLTYPALRNRRRHTATTSSTTTSTITTTATNTHHSGGEWSLLGTNSQRSDTIQETAMISGRR